MIKFRGGIRSTSFVLAIGIKAERMRLNGTNEKIARWNSQMDGTKFLIGEKIGKENNKMYKIFIDKKIDEIGKFI